MVKINEIYFVLHLVVYIFLIKYTNRKIKQTQNHCTLNKIVDLIVCWYGQNNIVYAYT